MKRFEFDRMRGVFPAVGLAFERAPTTEWVNDDVQHMDPYQTGHWETRAMYILRISLWWAEWELRYKGAIYAY